MSLGGTNLYSTLHQDSLPPLVKRAVAEAVAIGFDLCVHPATGRLLQVLAAGLSPGARVGETGTGTGAGLAWMASLADARVSFLSVEIDEARAAAAHKTFANTTNVEVLHGDASELYKRGPFDLLVFDGGWGSGKTGDRRVELAEVVKPFGHFTIDDFSPMTSWPPRFDGAVDSGRKFWHERSDVLSTEIQVAPNMTVLVGQYAPGASSRQKAPDDKAALADG